MLGPPTHCVLRPFAGYNSGPKNGKNGKDASAMQRKLDPITYSPAEVAKLIGISRTYAYELVQRGDIKSIRIGRRRLVLERDLNAYLERKRAEAEVGA